MAADMVDMVMLDEVIGTSIDEQLLLDDDNDGEIHLFASSHVVIKSRTSASSHRSIFAVPSGRSEHTDDTDGEEDLLLIGPPKELAVSKEKDSLHYIFINSKQHLDVILRGKHSKKRLRRNFNFFKH